MTQENLQAENAQLKRKLAEAEKARHPDHSHCITPCDSIRIQGENHSAFLLMKDRAEAAEREREKWEQYANADFELREEYKRKCAAMSEALTELLQEMEWKFKYREPGLYTEQQLEKALARAKAAIASQPAPEGPCVCPNPALHAELAAPNPIDPSKCADPKPEMSAEESEARIECHGDANSCNHSKPTPEAP
jgi:hypothetical protein